MSDLDKLLRFDPIAEGERLTGVSYKDKAAGEGFDNPAVAAGFVMAQIHADRKNRELLARGDTTFSNALDRYIAIITRVGFEKVYESAPFTVYEKTDRLLVYARRDGLLLAFDTYDTDRVNGGHLYYNWKPNGDIDQWWGEGITSSGGMRGDIWVGDHDCREALIHNIGRLEDHGKFIAPWKERPFLWLLHYGDTKSKDYDYNAINAERIAQFPEWAQKMVTP